jgi:tetratricopeptide (TPR) repeat protein
MTNDESKLTVFISSMIGPLWDERTAVEEAIRTGIPLARTWVFERAPASSEAIAESYLARVRDCDVYLLILGDDMSDPVKDEYRTAVECKKPRLCFVQEGVGRTQTLQEFLPVLQADVKYATFSDEESLRREVLRALQFELVRVYKAYYERLEAVRSAPFQAPTPTPHFQGREPELDALLDHLRPGAAVTLCGPGGIGKTALAAEALARLPEDRFPDGIIFHTFYRQPEAALALEHVARSYGHDPRPTPADAARMALAGKRALLVLDGTEEADDLGAVLACAGKCGVLVTSRRRGDAPDPSLRFDLGPLEESQAVALLRAWGGARAGDEEAAVAICRVVGRLPLAVQLAGAYLASHDEEAADYLAWLETTPLAALDFGQKQRRSVPVLMERSLERVSEKAQKALGLVGLMGFASFGREAIAAGLRVEEGEAGRALGELIDCGMLARQDGRYAVTHALVHTYARKRLSPGEKARGHLVAYYLALVQVTDDHAVLNAERPHLLAALADAHRRRDWETTPGFAEALKTWLDLQGHWTDWVAVLEQALDAARGLGDRSAEGAILGNLGNAYANLGQVEKAIDLYRQGLTIAREIGDRRGEGTHLANLGNAYANLGQVEKAIDLYQQGLTIAREIGDRRGEGTHLANLGIAYWHLGQVEKAIDLYRQGLTIAREIGDRRGEGTHLANLGIAYAALGQVEQAIEYYQKALEIHREIGYRRGEGSDLGNLGLAYAALGQVEQAVEYHQQALAISREIGDRRGEGTDLGNLGLAYADLGQVEKAIEYYNQALEIAREIGYRWGEGTHLANLGNAHRNLGQVEKAIESYNQALEIAREIGDRRGEGSDLGNLGLAYADLGQVEQAIEPYNQALEIAREIGYRRGEGTGLGNLGNAYAALGQVEEAIEYYQEALAISHEIGDRLGEGSWLGNLGLAYRDLGDTARARRYLSQALAIFEEIKSPEAERVRRRLAELD